MQTVLAQLKAFWGGRNANQRLLLAVGAMFTAGLIAVFAHMMTAPDYKTLITGLDPSDAQTLSSALTAKSIPNRIGPDGRSISVPADKLDAARLDAAATGSTRNGRMGFEIFDKASWGETEFDEKVNYQRALEGELERTIMTLGAVKNARVHLVMASDSIFLDQSHGAKASVTLQLRGGDLTRDEVMAIQRLVAGAVDGLKPADVAVIDADTGELLGTNQQGDGSGSEAGKQLAQQILATLDPVLGSGHVRASVNVEYDEGTTEEDQEKYDPTVSVPLTTQRSDDETGPAAGSRGVPGTASNLPANSKGKPAAIPQTPDSGSEISKTEDSTFGVNKTVIHSTEPAGRIRRITAALLVDDATVTRPLPHGHTQQVQVHRSAEELKQLQDLAEAAIGFDSSRGDVMTVEDISFAQPAPVVLPKVTLLAQAERSVSAFAVVLRTVGLILLFLLAYWLTIRPMQKHVLSTQLALPAGEGTLPALPDGQAPQLAAPPDEATRSAALREQLVQLVKTEPATSAQAVQSWMQGGSAQ